MTINKQEHSVIDLIIDAWRRLFPSASHRLVALDLAMRANDQHVAWPSVDTMARTSRLSRRAVQYVLSDLRDDGYLIIEQEAGDNRPRRYRVVPSVYPPINDREDVTMLDDHRASLGVHDVRDRGAPIAPNKTVIKQLIEHPLSEAADADGTLGVVKGVSRRAAAAAMPPASDHQRAFYRTYSNVCGDITPTLCDRIDALAARFTIEWMEAACIEAAENNARSLKYITAILERWSREGFQSKRGKSNGRTSNGGAAPSRRASNDNDAWRAAADREEQRRKRIGL